MNISEADARSYFRVLPDACVEIFINCSPLPVADMKAWDIAGTYQHSMVNFRLKSFVDVRTIEGNHCIAICFHPAAASRFFPFPAGAADSVLTLDEVWECAGRQLEEQIVLAANDVDRVAIAQQYLEDRLVLQPGFDKSVSHCLWQVNLYKGQLTAHQLADKAGLSQRQLSRKFNNTVGISPKEFLRLSRFIHSVRKLDEGGSLTRIAHESGYYDQAHCIHDYKEFAGLTPGELREAANILYC